MIDCEYAVRACATGRLTVVMTGLDSSTTMEKARVFIWRPMPTPASVTCAIKFETPATVGVPEITPPELKESPGGREPLKITQLSGGCCPPVAASVTLGYGVPTSPLGRDVVVMTSRGLMTSV